MAVKHRQISEIVEHPTFETDDCMAVGEVIDIVLSKVDMFIDKQRNGEMVGNVEIIRRQGETMVIAVVRYIDYTR